MVVADSLDSRINISMNLGECVHFSDFNCDWIKLIRVNIQGDFQPLYSSVFAAPEGCLRHNNIFTLVFCFADFNAKQTVQ